jgi:ABC transporter DrrB family efflux protein
MKAHLYGFWSIAAKEILHLKRDQTSLIIALLIPVVQLIIFGFAINLDVRHIPAVVVDLDKSSQSRDYLASVQNTHYVRIIGYAPTPDAAAGALRSGSARVAIIVPPDFARRSAAGEAAPVRVLIDGSDSIVATSARLAFMPPGANTLAEARLDVLFNPQLRTATFMIPGLIAVILQIVTVSLTASSLVREREQGTLEQLMVSPVGRLGLMLGKLQPYALLSMLEIVAVLVISRYVFDVRVAGNVWLLLLLSVPFIVAALSLGLLISTIAQNQAQALQMTLLIMLPSILMSGFMFPRETMPGALYLVSNALPITYFLEILRGIIVRGAVLNDLWPSILALVLIAAFLLALSASRFRKSIA